MSLFHYVIAPVLEMRREPSRQAEVVSQGLFSEEVHIYEERDGWLHIQTIADNYSGWAKKEGVHTRSTPFPCPSQIKMKITRLAAHLYEQPDTIYGPVLTLPFESELEVVDFTGSENSRWLSAYLPDQRQLYIQRGDLTSVKISITCEQMCRLSHAFLGLPYTWGGRSSFGYDCSGFVQMLYRQMGISLPRDSKDQFAHPGFHTCSVESLHPGDLIFFGFSPEQIRHVGLSLGNGSFIHTSAVTENQPYLRISHITDSAWNGSGYYPFASGRKMTLLHILPHSPQSH